MGNKKRKKTKPSIIKRFIDDIYETIGLYVSLILLGSIVGILGTKYFGLDYKLLLSNWVIILLIVVALTNFEKIIKFVRSIFNNHK